MNHRAGGPAVLTRLGRAVRVVGDTTTGAPEPQHREEHRQANWLRDVILGGQDGSITDRPTRRTGAILISAV